MLNGARMVAWWIHVPIWKLVCPFLCLFVFWQDEEEKVIGAGITNICSDVVVFSGCVSVSSSVCLSPCFSVCLHIYLCTCLYVCLSFDKIRRGKLHEVKPISAVMSHRSEIFHFHQIFIKFFIRIAPLLFSLECQHSRTCILIKSDQNMMMIIWSWLYDQNMIDISWWWSSFILIVDDDWTNWGSF